MAQGFRAEEARRAARLATPLFWAAAGGADVALVASGGVADVGPALGVAVVCQGAIYLTLWAFMRGVRWAVAEI